MSGAQALKGGKLRVVCMGCCILIDMTPRLFRNQSGLNGAVWEKETKQKSFFNQSHSCQCRPALE